MNLGMCSQSGLRDRLLLKDGWSLSWSGGWRTLPPWHKLVCVPMLFLLFLPLIESELKISSLTQRPLQEGECDGIEQVMCCKPGPVSGLLSSHEVRISPGALRKAFGMFRHWLMFNLCFWLFIYFSPWTHSLAQVTQVVWGLCGRKRYNRKCRHKFTVIY